MPETTTARKPFNLLLSPDEYTMLKKLAEQSGQSAGTELRTALRARFSMLCIGCATCASGSACFVPHMHAPRPMSPNGIPQA